MKPAPFEYAAPESVDEVVALLAEHGDEAKIIAGGQSLLPMMALRLARPSVLVDVGRIAGLATVQTNGSLRLGSGVSQATLEHDPAVRAGCPLIPEVMPLVAHTAIRNRGTVGGSLAHADPAAELPAVALLCGFELLVSGPGGTRVVAADDFFVSYLTTALEPDEVLVEIRVPPVPARTGRAFREVSRRHGDFALVGVGASVTVGGTGAITAARIAFIGVDSVPVAVDLPLADGDDAEDAGRAAAAALDPPDDLHATAAYRRYVGGVLAADVLRMATAAAKERS